MKSIILLLCLLLSGCVSPSVVVYKVVIIHDNKEKVTVTYQANSITGVDAEVDQEFKELFKLPMIP